MGIPLFPFALTLLAAVTAAPDPQVMREERFQSVLAEMDLAAAEQACLNPRIANSDGRRQALRDRLLELHPVIDSLELVLANAEALMSCGAPEAAAVVLSRYIPRVGDERRQIFFFQDYLIYISLVCKFFFSNDGYLNTNILLFHEH